MWTENACHTNRNNGEIKQAPRVGKVTSYSIRRQFEEEFKKKDNVEDFVELVNCFAQCFFAEIIYVFVFKSLQHYIVQYNQTQSDVYWPWRKSILRSRIDFVQARVVDSIGYRTAKQLVPSIDHQ